uniref:Uncharacterized protein n=1 Tax=Oryza barthii TaxID=65489 RepID=A0A0D3F2G0_9ORYZ
MELEELEDGEDDVVDVAEAGGLGLLGVVQPAGPVDGDVVGAVVELDGGADGGPRVGVEAVEDGAVRADVEAAEGADLAELGLRGDGAEEGDVVVGVEAAEVDAAGGERAEHLHLGRGEEAVVGEQRVGHPHPVGLHRVALTVVVVAHLRVHTRRFCASPHDADASELPPAPADEGSIAASASAAAAEFGVGFFSSLEELACVLWSGACWRRKRSRGGDAAMGEEGKGGFI